MNKKFVAAILAALVLDAHNNACNSDAIKKKQRVWVKDWVKKREQEGFCVKLLKELQEEEPTLYRNFVRMTREQFDYLCNLVKPLIEKENTQFRKSISASDRLVLTLRFLATGDSFKSLQYLFRIPQPTISAIIPEVLDAIYKVLVEEYLKLFKKIPTSPAEWENISRKFDELWHYPNCIGAVDGKHVVMNAPPNSGSVFYNYKGTHSIVLMGIASADYKLLYVDVGRNGRSSDGGTFNHCSFAQALERQKLALPSPKPLPGREMPIPYVLVSDDAFALRQNVMKPYNQKNLGMVDRVYNYRHNLARHIIENVFGIISARFRVLRKPIALDAEKSKKITLACCVLHNFLLTTNKQTYAPSKTFDRLSSTGEIIDGEWRQESPGPVGTMHSLQNASTNSMNGKEVQKEFAEYFVNEGELEWQYKFI